MTRGVWSSGFLGGLVLWASTLGAPSSSAQMNNALKDQFYSSSYEFVEKLKS